MFTRTLALLALLVCFSLPVAAQPLDPSWLGTPEALDYDRPDVYWQRVYAVHSGRMTEAQRVQVQDYIRTWQPPLSPTLEPCSPYVQSVCWDAPVTPVAPPPLPVFRVGRTYVGAYGWRMRVVSLVTEAGDEIVTGRWVGPSPNAVEVGDVFAFRNSVSQVWQEEGSRQ